MNLQPSTCRHSRHGEALWGFKIAQSILEPLALMCSRGARSSRWDCPTTIKYLGANSISDGIIPLDIDFDYSKRFRTIKRCATGSLIKDPLSEFRLYQQDAIAPETIRTLRQGATALQLPFSFSLTAFLRISTRICTLCSWGHTHCTRLPDNIGDTQRSFFDKLSLVLGRNPLLPEFTAKIGGQMKGNPFVTV